MTRVNAVPALEPSAEAVKAVRDRLRERAIGVTDDVVREVLRIVLSIEGARLDRRAREAAAACLLRIQEATREALAVLAQGPQAVTAPLSAVPPPPAAAPPKPTAAPPPPRRDSSVNLAEIVRQRLGNEAHEDPKRPREPLNPTPPPSPARPLGEPRRPVFKRPRGR